METNFFLLLYSNLTAEKFKDTPFILIFDCTTINCEPIISNICIIKSFIIYSNVNQFIPKTISPDNIKRLFKVNKSTQMFMLHTHKFMRQ